MTQTKKSWLQEREGRTYLLEQLCCRCEKPLKDIDYTRGLENPSIFQFEGRRLCLACQSQILNNQSTIKEKLKTPKSKQSIFHDEENCPECKKEKAGPPSKIKVMLPQDCQPQKEEQHHGYHCECGKAGLYRVIYGGHGSVFCGFCAN